MTDSMVSHWDACLGCMACVTACPSGVQYDRLIEQTRAQVERRHERSAKDKALRGLIFSLFPHPRRLRLLRGPLRLLQASGLDRALRRTGLLERIAPQLAAMERLAPRLGKPERLPARTSGGGPAPRRRRPAHRLRAGSVLPGRQRRHRAGAAGRGLRRASCRAAQGCCGALSVHNGREPEGQDFARKLVDAFEQAGVELRRGELGRLRLHDEGVRRPAGRRPGVRRPRAVPSPSGSVTSRRSSTSSARSRRGTRSRCPSPTTTRATSATPRACARSPVGCSRPSPGSSSRRSPRPSCAAARPGSTTSSTPSPRSELGDRKAANIVATGAEVLVTANPGCLMQVTSAIERSGHPMGMAHTIEVLDASIRGAPVATLLPT